MAKEPQLVQRIVTGLGHACVVWSGVASHFFGLVIATLGFF